MQLRGSERALGTLKITHENPSLEANYDKDAAALSIDIVKNRKAEKVLLLKESTLTQHQARQGSCLGLETLMMISSTSSLTVVLCQGNFAD